MVALSRIRTYQKSLDGPTHVEKLGYNTKMAAKVALCPLWDAFAALGW